MKLEQDGTKRVFTCFGLAVGDGTGPRSDFAVGEALRRALLEGRFRAAPEGRPHAGRRRA